MLKILSLISDILFPLNCLGCGQDGIIICDTCLHKINVSKLTFIIPGIEHSLIACDYNQKNVATLIKQLKYNNLKNNSQPLGQLLVQRLGLENDIPNFTIIPIPLHKKRLKRRGFNQSQLLAETVAKNFHCPINTSLVRIKNTQPQASLKEKQRHQNMIDAFAYPGPKLTGQNILLIDDVTTTGATLMQAAKVLRAQNPQSIWSLVIAKHL